MKQISPNIYEHEGIKAEAVVRQSGRPCNGCPFDIHGHPCPLPEKTCTPIIGADKVFRKYKEPETVKKTELNDLIFSVIVLTPERSKILQEAVFAVDGKWPDGIAIVRHTGKPVISIFDGKITIDNDIALGHPTELTLQQALDLLATVEKSEPVFDIKQTDLVLARDRNTFEWLIHMYSMTATVSFMVPDCKAKIIKYHGNEALTGTTDTPAGWWEAKDGKPIWITK